LFSFWSLCILSADIEVTKWTSRHLDAAEYCKTQISHDTTEISKKIQETFHLANASNHVGGVRRRDLQHFYKRNKK
jgi:hypothetical protein